MTFTAYSNSGPFTNNVVPPGISSTFLNNIENFLDQIDSSAVADANITANGSGALTAVSLTLSGSGTGLTVQHNATITGTLTQTGAASFNAAGTGLTVAHNATVSGALTVNGATTLNGVLNLIAGSISRIAFGFSAATTGGTAITHGLGTTPTLVLICPRTTQTTFAVDSVGSTTFTAFVGTNCNVWWLAIA